MKISEKQILFMYQVLLDTMSIVSPDFKFDRETRKMYANEIFNQQSEEPKEIE